MNNVVIFGVGDYAQVASVYLRKDSPYNVCAFTVHEEYIRDRTLLGLPVVPFETLARSHPPEDFAMLVAVGFRRVNRLRADLFAQGRGAGYAFIKYVCSNATVIDDVTLGDNSFVFENNVIQPFASIGENAVLWSGNHIGHHACIGDHCFIASHAVISGNVHIEPFSFIGVNATLREGVRVGRGSIIGAGALVNRDVPAETVLRGPEGVTDPRPSSSIRSFQ